MAHNELHGLGAPHCDKATDALITPDGERPHSVPGLPKYGLLSCQLLEHLHVPAAASAARNPRCRKCVPDTLGSIK